MISRSKVSGLFFIGCASGIAQELGHDAIDFPWSPHERLEYSIYEKVGGTQIGAAVFRIDPAERDGQNLWKIQIETLLDQPAVTVVEVDRSSFLPVYSYYRSEVLGEIEVTYQSGGVSVERRLHPNSKQLKQEASTYDLYQSCYLMRMFDVEEGYQKKVFITNSKRPIEQSPATLRVVDVDILKTRSGEKVRCYRVDAKIDEIRSTFWISADDKRWLYRIVDDSGISFELIPPASSVPSVREFESQQYGYRFELPRDWMAFLQEKRKGPDREQVAIMSPGLGTNMTLTRHRKFGDYQLVADGSLQWLQKNRKHFELLPGIEELTLNPGDPQGKWFCGRYFEDKKWQYVFNAVVVSGDNLLIFTGVAESTDFEQAKGDMERLVRSIQSKGN